MILKNTETWDRVTRMGFGLLMLALGWYGNVGSWAVPLRVFAPYPLITGLIGWCPVYALLGFSSRQR